MQGKPLGFPIQKRGLTDSRNCSNLPYSSLAQSVEHLTVNQGVTGSSPVGGANQNLNRTQKVWFRFFSYRLNKGDYSIKLQIVAIKLYQSKCHLMFSVKISLRLNKYLLAIIRDLEYNISKLFLR